MTEEINGWRLLQQRMWMTTDNRAKFHKVGSLELYQLTGLSMSSQHQSRTSTQTMWVVQCTHHADEERLKAAGIVYSFGWFQLHHQLKHSLSIVADILDCSRSLRVNQHSGYIILGTGQGDRRREGLFIYRDGASWYVRVHPNFVSAEYQRAGAQLYDMRFTTRAVLLETLNQYIEPPTY